MFKNHRPAQFETCEIKTVTLFGFQKIMVQQDRVELQFGIYQGQLQGGKPHGDGICTFFDGDAIVSIDSWLSAAIYHSFDIQGRKVYEGQWQNGRRSGHGRMVYTTGEEYIGGWNSNLQVIIERHFISMLWQVVL